jgi:hypothetical protein
MFGSRSGAPGRRLHTWSSLAANNGIPRTEAVELVTALVEAAAAPQRRAAA